MTQPYFSALLPQLAQKAARSTVNLLGFAERPLRRHLLELFGQEIGNEGSFIGDPTFEAVFGWKAGASTMLELSAPSGQALLTSELVRAMNDPPASLAGEYRFSNEQRPYAHQVTAWRTLSEPTPKSVVVASGTGSGKTECFLVPILDQLIREQMQLGTPLVGVRALLLYPLNALINSQRDRLRAWTSGLKSNIRFCLYNGNTPDQVRSTRSEEFPGEVRDRRTLRASPPPILVTNSTMLEYMLVRSQDAPIIEQSRGKLRWIVLDEAHSYIGSQAAELSLMLRRVLHAFDVSPDQVRFVATSATIGDPNGEPGRQLRRFLSDVAGVSEERVRVIAGEREIPALPQVSVTAKADVEELSAIDAANELSSKRFAAAVQSAQSREIRNLLVGDPGRPAVARLSEVVAALERVENAVVSPQRALEWLDFASGVRDTDKTPFLPLRGHLFHQSLPGLWGCVDPECNKKASTSLKDADWPFGAIYLSVRQYCDCGSPCYQVVTCDECGTVFLEAEHSQEGRLLQHEDVEAVDEFRIELEADPDGDEQKNEEEPASAGFAALVANRPLPGTDVRHVHRSTRRIIDSGSSETVEARLHEDGGDGLICPACHGRQTHREQQFRKARIGAPFLLSGILPILLEYAPDGDAPADRPYRGRRLLTFSDSRQGTARLAARLQQDSERSRVRGLVYHHAIRYAFASASTELDALKGKITQIEAMLTPGLPPQARDYLESQVRQHRAELAALSNPRPISFTDLRQRLVSEGRDFDRMLATYRSYSHASFGEAEGPVTLAGMLLVREFGRRPRRQNNLETMGLVAVQYPLLEKLTDCPEIWKRRGMGPSQWRQFLKLAVDHGVRNAGAIDLRPEWRDWLGMRMKATFLVRQDREETSRNQRRWPSVQRSGPRSTVVRLLAALLDSPIDSATGRDEVDECLSHAWNALVTVGLLQPASDGHVLRLESLAFAPMVEGWVCPVTRRVLDTTVRELTPYLPSKSRGEINKCEKVCIPVYGKPFGGDASPVEHVVQARTWMEANEDVRRLRDEGLWSDLHDRVVELSPYFSAAEHSAQQSAETLDRYERDFKDGRLNLLSCSTTMEMGIDIGGVRLVAMNNVPPHPANYLQRAGRAGRRRELRSCAVTLCKSNPHDQSAFRNSRWAFDVSLPSPSVSLNSPIIVQRHVNALVLSVVLRRLRPVGTADLNKLTCGWFFESGDASPAGRFEDFCLSFVPAEAQSLTDGLTMLVRRTVFAGQDMRLTVKRSAEMLMDVATRWRAELQGLEAEKPQGNEPAARAIEFQKRRLTEEYLLKELATRGFLPAHGFPTSIAAFDNLTIDDLKRLPRNPEGGRDDNRLRRRDLPSRDLTTALREYAPGADVVIDGRVFRSAGITLNWHIPASETDANEVQSIRYAWRCRSCGASGSAISFALAGQCEACGEKLDAAPMPFLEPAGFSVEFASHPHNDVSTQGFVPVEAPWVSASGDWAPFPNPDLGRFRSTPRGHVFHYSSGQSHHGYALCLSCGRAEPMPQPGVLPDVFKRPHSRLRGGKGLDRGCVGSESTWSIKPGLSLGHEGRTDVLEIQIRDAAGTWLNDVVAAQTIAVALRNTLAERLGVQAVELACAVKSARVDAGNVASSILLFDQNAAGYATAVDEVVGELLAAARAKLECRRSCDSACPDCILDFDQRFQAERLDRHRALRWLSQEWLHALKLPEELRYFGQSSRVEYAALETAIGRASSRGHVEVVRLFAHGDPKRWDIGGSSLRQLTFDLSARGLSVEIVVEEGSLTKTGEDDRYLLASLADHPRTSVATRQTCPRAGQGWVLAEVLRSDEAVYWATGSEEASIFDEYWGRAGEVVITGRSLQPQATSADKRSGSELRPSSVVAGDVELSIHREVDGPLMGFGNRLWKRIEDAHPTAQALLADTTEVVQSVRYSDRYLHSPWSVALLKQVLVGLRMKVGADRWKEVPVAVATMGGRVDYRASRSPFVVTDDWPSADARNQVLEAAIKSVPANPAITNADRSSLAHGRALEVSFSSGKCLTVRFDQGVSYWRSGSTGQRSGDSQRRFPFNETTARQWQQLAQVALPVEGDSHPTQLFVKVR